MNIIILIYFIVGLVLGFIIGMLAWGYVLIRRWLIGNILYAEVDGETAPYLSLDLDKYPQEFKDNKYVLCRVKVTKLDVKDSPQK